MSKLRPIWYHVVVCAGYKKRIIWLGSLWLSEIQLRPISAAEEIENGGFHSNLELPLRLQLLEQVQISSGQFLLSSHDKMNISTD